MTEAALSFGLALDPNSLAASMVEAQRSVQTGLKSMLSSVQSEAQKIENALGKIGQFQGLQSRLKELEAEYARVSSRNTELANKMVQVERPTKDLTDALKANATSLQSIQSNIARTDSALAQLGGALKTAGVNTGSLGSEQTKLQNTLAQTEKRIHDLQAVASAKVTLGLTSAGDMAAQIAKIETAYTTLKNSGISDIAELNRAQEAMKGKIDGIRQAIQSETQTFKDFGTLGVRSTDDVKQRIALLTSAYASLAASGKVSVSDLSRAQSALKDGVTEIWRSVEKGGQAWKDYSSLGVRSTKEIERELSQLNAAYARLSASGNVSIHDLSRAHAALRTRTAELNAEMGKRPFVQGAVDAGRLTTSVNTTSSSFLSLRQVVAGVGLTFLARDIVQTGLSMERLNAVLYTLAGSSEGAKREFEYIRKEANLLGLDMLTLGNSYGKFAVAARESGVSANQTREIFHAFALTATAMKLPSEALEGMFRAIGQMMSKGKVQAEELRGQLGEHLPGAFALIAKAMGVTQAELNKMLEKGEVVTNNMLPKLAKELIEKFGPASEKASKGAQSAFNRFFNLLFEKKDIISQEINPALAAMGNAAVKAVSNPEVDAGLKNFGKNLADVLGFLREYGPALVSTAGGLVAWTVAVKSASAAQAILLSVTGLSWVQALGAVGASSTAAAIATGRFGDALKLIGAYGAYNFGVAAGNVTTFATAIGVATTATRAFIATPIGAALSVLAVGYTAATIYQDKQTEAIKASTAAREREAQQMTFFTDIMENFVRSGTSLTNANIHEPLYKLALAVKDGALSFEEAKRRATEYKDAVLRSNGQLIAAQSRLAAAEQTLATTTIEEQRKILESKIKSAQEGVREAEQALNESLRMEKQYTDEVIALNHELARMKMSDADRIREIERKGMSEKEAELDREKQAHEKILAAKEAAANAKKSFEAGDIESATQFADESKRLAEEAKNMASGLKNTQTALKDFKDASDVANTAQKQLIDISSRQAKEQQQNTNQIVDALDSQERSVSRLKDSLAKLDGQTATAKARVQVDEAMAAVARIKAELATLQDKTVTINVKTVNSRRWGGPIGLNYGGHLPGWGGGDRIQALLEAGEFVMRKEAVKKYGLGMMYSLNQMRLPDMPKFQLGGLVQHLVIPHAQTLAFANGGAIPSSPVNRFDVRFNGAPVAKSLDPEAQLRGLVNLLQLQQQGRDR